MRTDFSREKATPRSLFSHPSIMRFNVPSSNLPTAASTAITPMKMRAKATILRTCSDPCMYWPSHALTAAADLTEIHTPAMSERYHNHIYGNERLWPRNSARHHRRQGGHLILRSPQHHHSWNPGRPPELQTDLDHPDTQIWPRHRSAARIICPHSANKFHTCSPICIFRFDAMPARKMALTLFRPYGRNSAKHFLTS